MHVLLDARLLHRPTSGLERVQHNLLCALAEHPDVTRLGALVLAGLPLARPLPGRVERHEVTTSEDVLAVLLPEDAAARPDVLHLTFFPDQRPRDLLFLAAARSSVVSVTDAILNRHPEYHPTPAEHSRYDRFVRELVRHADRVLSYTGSAQQEAVQLGADPARVDVAPLAIDPALAVPLDPAEVARRLAALGVAGDWFVALGKDYPHKDHATLLHALARLDRPVTLICAGSRVWHGPLPGGRTFDELVRGLGLADRVRWIDGLPDDDVKALLQGSVGLVYPSREEGFGLPPLEAMHLGVPVVAAAAMSIPEVCGDGALLFPPGDVDALVLRLRALLAGGPAVAAGVDRGRARALAFTWQACAAGVVACYRRAVAAAEPRRDGPPRDAATMYRMLRCIAHDRVDGSDVRAWRDRYLRLEGEFRLLEEHARALRAALPRWSLKRRLGKLRRAWQQRTERDRG